MHACSTTTYLPVEIVVDCSYVLTVKPSQPDVEMARVVVLRYGGESASVPGCLCDGTGTLVRLVSLWYDQNLIIAVCLLRESLCFAGLPPMREHCSEEKIAVNGCNAETWTAPEERRP